MGYNALSLELLTEKLTCLMRAPFLYYIQSPQAEWPAFNRAHDRPMFPKQSRDMLRIALWFSDVNSECLGWISFPHSDVLLILNSIWPSFSSALYHITVGLVSSTKYSTSSSQGTFLGNPAVCGSVTGMVAELGIMPIHPHPFCLSGLL